METMTSDQPSVNGSRWNERVRPEIPVVVALRGMSPHVRLSIWLIPFPFEDHSLAQKDM
jgi:hypothetical protein